ncbi:MAG: Arginine deiminase [Firmicutes bacterium]|nr:Arginine deiminase [Bacillota bacterium]
MAVKLPLVAFGAESSGRLRAVMIHKPVVSITDINAVTAGYYMFDQVPDAEQYAAEHERYKSLLLQHQIEVYELAEFVQRNKDKMNILASLTYLNDSSVITRNGAVLSKMGYGRAGEEIVVKEALTNLGVPICYEFSEADQFEGFLILSPRTAFIACTERHRMESVEKFISYALTLFPEIIYVDVVKARRYMHADMLFGKVNDNLALVYMPAFLKAQLITQNGRQDIADFRQFMFERQMELISVSPEEQQQWACSFIPLDAKTMFHYDIALKAQTKKQLYSKGIEIIEFHPHALLAGGGSLRCLTLMLLRD